MVRVGQTLCGKFRVEAMIGQGGMASVWQGTHIATGRRIAIKVLDDRFLGNAGVVARFGREARAASAVHHESIVDVMDLDRTEDGTPFLVMEFLEGETLTDRIERLGRLSEEDLIAIADPLLDAVHAAHEAGVVHRDLKPDNIMLVRAGRRGEKLKVLDFGISSKADEISSLTTTGSLLGTPHYMSPEQAKGRTDIDARADVYAIGVLLYECAVGDVPFDADNYNALIQEILNTPPVPPRARGATISEAVEAVLMRAIAKDRNDRPVSADAMRERLLEVGRQPAASSTSGAFPAVRISPMPPAASARGGRGQLPTLDDASLKVEPPPLAKPPPPPPRPSAPRPTNVSPLATLPSTPPGPSEKLELDVRAVRHSSRGARPTPRSTPRVGSSDDTPAPPRSWARVAIVVCIAAVMLIVVVRLVVRPDGLLRAAGAARAAAALTP
jgi:serine/threonine protein kinase